MAVLSVDLKAYLDESGIEAGARFCSIAGFIGSPRQWDLFDIAWSRALSVAPHIKSFHAGDFFGHRGDFRQLTKPIRDAMARGILKAIDSHNLTPFGVMLDLSVFNGLSYKTRRFLTGASIKSRDQRESWRDSGAPGKPFFAALSHCLMLAAGLTQPGKIVHLVFDQQDQYSALALTQFNRIKTGALVEGAEKLGGCVFMDRKEVSALQAADLLVHCWNAYASALAESREVFDARGDFAQRALQERIYAFERITKGRDRELCVFRTGEDFTRLLRRNLPERILSKVLDGDASKGKKL